GDSTTVTEDLRSSAQTIGRDHAREEHDSVVATEIELLDAPNRVRRRVPVRRGIDDQNGATTLTESSRDQQRAHADVGGSRKRRNVDEREIVHVLEREQTGALRRR